MNYSRYRLTFKMLNIGVFAITKARVNNQDIYAKLWLYNKLHYREPLNNSKGRFALYIKKDMYVQEIFKLTLRDVNCSISVVLCHSAGFYELSSCFLNCAYNVMTTLN